MHVCMCNKFGGAQVAGFMHRGRFTTHEVRIGWETIKGSILKVLQLFRRSLGVFFGSSYAKNRLETFNGR